jgi:hypothetical protein
MQCYLGEIKGGIGNNRRQCETARKKRKDKEKNPVKNYTNRQIKAKRVGKE